MRYEKNPTFEHQPAALAPTTGQGCALPCLSDSDGCLTLAAARSDIDLALWPKVFQPREVVSGPPHRQPAAGSGCAAAIETNVAVVMGPDCCGVQKISSLGQESLDAVTESWDTASAAEKSELDPFWMDWQQWLLYQVQNLSTS